MDIEMLLNYGYETVIIAIIIVTVIGIIKTFLKAKYGSKVNWLKFIYQTICVVLAVISTIIYNLIKGYGLFNSTQFYINIVSTIAAVQLIYSFYENYGLRKLFDDFALLS